MKINPYATATIFLLVCSTIAGVLQAIFAKGQAKAAKKGLKIAEGAAEAARRQAETAERGLAIAERQTIAAEQQLADARAAINAAVQERETANQRASIADEQAKLAHEQMKVALAPQLVMLRIQDRNSLQKFFIENQGLGLANGITWDYMNPIKPTDGVRLFQGFSTNVIAPNSRQEFRFDYDRFQQPGMMFRYSSWDGRIFWSHVSVADAFGGFRHEHFLDTD